MSNHHPSLDASNSRLFYFNLVIVIFILIFAPLIYGGNRPLPQLVLETTSIILLIGFFLSNRLDFHLPKNLIYILLVIVALPLIQLVPIPEALWADISGRDFYADALNRVFPDQMHAGYHSISLDPYITELGFYALLPAVSVLLVIGRMPVNFIIYCVFAFIFIATIQAILALAQSSSGVPGFGTFANRNHLAGMLAMSLPLVLGILADNFGKPKKFHTKNPTSSTLKKISDWVSSTPAMNAVMLLSVLAILIALGIIFSRSRAGIAIMMLGLLLSALLFGQMMGKKKSIQLSGLIFIIIITLAIEIGLAPVVSRFGADAAFEDARWSIFTHVYEGLQTFFPVGSGIGSFPEVFRRFQPEDVSGFVNHAHNGYLEYVFEGGLIAMLIIIFFSIIYLMRWPALLAESNQNNFHYIQIGAGISILLLGLHESVDFNLHIPANLIYFAFLVAVFFYQADKTYVHDLKPHAIGKNNHHAHSRLRVTSPRIAKPSVQLKIVESDSNPFNETSLRNKSVQVKVVESDSNPFDETSLHNKPDNPHNSP